MPDGRCVPGARGTHVPPAHTGLESPAGPSIKCSQMNRKATCPKRWLLWEEASSGCFHLPLHQQQAPEGGAQGQGHRVWPEEQGRGPTLHPRQRHRGRRCAGRRGSEATDRKSGRAITRWDDALRWEEGTEAAPRRVRRGSELREKQESVESGTCTDSLCPGPPSRPPKGLGVKQSPSRFGADIITKGTCAQSQLEAGPRGTARSSHVHQVY